MRFVKSACAYGILFIGQQFPDRFIATVDSWPTWAVDVRISPQTPPRFWSSERAVIAMQPHGAAVLDRARSRTELVLPEPPMPEGFAHPLLGLTAVGVAAWRGLPAFHAGAFVVDGKAWIVSGDTEAGKSSLLGWLAGHDVPIVADDLCIVADGEVFAGPRCVDLREPASVRLGLGTDVGVLGTRQRWRVPLPDIAPSVPVGGWIRPVWSDEVTLRRLDAARRMRMIAASQAWGIHEPDAAQLLPLLGLPAFEFGRPQDWDQMDAAAHLLLDQLARTAGRT